VLTGYLCPSDPYPTPSQNTATSWSQPNIWGSGRVPIALSNYIGNCGTVMDCNLTDRNGLFHNNSNIRLRDITDGTSNTLMIMERDTFQYPPRTGVSITRHMGAVWGGTTVGNMACTNEDAYSVVGCIRVTYGEINGSATRVDGRDPASQHTGGINVCLADGSVRFLSENINLTTATNLCVRNDGLVLGEF